MGGGGRGRELAPVRRDVLEELGRGVVAEVSHFRRRHGRHVRQDARRRRRRHRHRHRRRAGVRQARHTRFHFTYFFFSISLYDFC